MVSYIRKGTVSVHLSWPLESIEDFEKIKKLVGLGNISNLFVGLGKEFLRKQGIESEAPKEPSCEAPRIMAPKEEVDKYLSQRSIDELSANEGWALGFANSTKKHWTHKKFPPKKRLSRLEQIQEVLDK